MQITAHTLGTFSIRPSAEAVQHRLVSGGIYFVHSTAGVCGTFSRGNAAFDGCPV